MGQYINTNLHSCTRRDCRVRGTAANVSFAAAALFIESNRRTYQAGEEHPNRTNIGVFDMLFVHEGALHLAEGDNKWLLGPGDVLILRPDSYHYSYQPCQETTVFDWIHFQTVGAWEETEGSQSGSLRETIIRMLFGCRKNSPVLPGRSEAHLRTAA